MTNIRILSAKIDNNYIVCPVGLEMSYIYSHQNNRNSHQISRDLRGMLLLGNWLPQMRLYVRLLAGRLVFLKGGEDEHFAGLLSGDCVHEEILDEHFRTGSVRNSVLLVVVFLEIVHFCDRLKWTADLNSLAVCTGDTVALRSGSLDDELQILDSLRLALKLESELRRSQRDHSLSRSLYALEGRRIGDGLTAAGNDPVVQARIEIGT